MLMNVRVCVCVCAGLYCTDSECVFMGVFMSVCQVHTVACVAASRFLSTVSQTVFPCNISSVSECHGSESKVTHLHIHLGVHIVASWLMGSSS